MLCDLILRCCSNEDIGSLGLLISLSHCFGGQHNTTHRHILQRHRNQILNLKRYHLFELGRVAEGKRESSNKQILAGEGGHDVATSVQAVLPEKIPQVPGKTSWLAAFWFPKCKGKMKIFD